MGGIVKKVKFNTPVLEKLVSPTEREQQIISDYSDNTTFLPKTVKTEDIDLGVFELIEKGDLKIVIDGKDCPTIFMDNERWAEFSKTWQYTNDDKNIVFPFIAVKRGSLKKGTYSGVKFNIPNNKVFTTIKVPTFDNGAYGYDIYQIPQPTPIDIDYEIKLFTRYIQDINEFAETYFKEYASKQLYINVNDNYFRTETDDDLDDESTLEDIDGERFHVITFNITCHGYLQDEKDFKIIKGFSRTVVNFES